MRERDAMTRPRTPKSEVPCTDLANMQMLEAVIDDLLNRYDELSPTVMKRLDDLLDYINTSDVGALVDKWGPEW
jgi:hypothetical protein